MFWNRLNRESEKEREVEFRLLSLSQSFCSQDSALYATLLANVNDFRVYAYLEPNSIAMDRVTDSSAALPKASGTSCRQLWVI